MVRAIRTRAQRSECSGSLLLRPQGAQESPEVLLKCRFGSSVAWCLGFLFLTSSWVMRQRLVWRPCSEQGVSIVLGNVASMHLRSEAQQCICDMPRNHRQRVEGVGGGGGDCLGRDSHACLSTLHLEHGRYAYSC